jgi:hypothetical protein
MPNQYWVEYIKEDKHVVACTYCTGHDDCGDGETQPDGHWQHHLYYNDNKTLRLKRKCD